MFSRQINKPKTHRGSKFLKKREPHVFENDKQTLIIKGARTSDIISNFLTDIYLLKKPFVQKLKWKNNILPFEDASFIERMCNKMDCSLFIVGMHSKKRPNNVVIGRVHDHEILDMYELGIDNYKSMRSTDVKFSLGAKPLLVFSGEAFDENEELNKLKSLLIDLFKGPSVSRINSSGIEHVIHFIMPTEDKLLLRVNGVSLLPLNKDALKKDSIDSDYFAGDDIAHSNADALKTPWGPYVQIELRDSAPEVDFTLRRRNMPSEDKWKRAMRVPAESRPRAGKIKNQSMDVFGSKVAQVHVSREHALDQLRPGASIRTALTGKGKRGSDRQNAENASNKKQKVRIECLSEVQENYINCFTLIHKFSDLFFSYQ